MQFEEIWQKYDFTEAELLSMGWQFPYDYVLNFNYYWELNPSSTASEVATEDRFLKLILESCIRLDVQLDPNPIRPDRPPASLGTIAGWGKVTPSPWLQSLSLPADEWVHVFFEIGAKNKIEALARSLTIEQLTLAIASSAGTLTDALIGKKRSPVFPTNSNRGDRPISAKNLS